MAENSKFELRWEIEDCLYKLGKNTASEVFNEGGFEWTAGFHQNLRNLLKLHDFKLTCNNPQGGKWRCEVDVEFVLVSVNHPLSEHTSKERILFTNASQVHTFSEFALLEYCYRGDVVAKFIIEIVSERRSIHDIVKFSSPNVLNNVTLVIGGKKLHVSREYLSLHSPVFTSMFFGDLSENGKNEIYLNDIVYEEFVDLLAVIFPGRAKITDSTIAHVLRLGYQFQMEHVLDLSETHLVNSRTLNTRKKRDVAKKYRLGMLKKICVKELSSRESVHNSSMATIVPKYTVRWEINRSRSRLAAGTESKVFNQGGFEWKTGLRTQRGNSHHEITLTCDKQNGGKWRCEVNVELQIARKDDVYTEKARVVFTDADRVHTFTDFSMPQFILKNKTSMKFLIEFINDIHVPAPIIDVNKFISPVDSNNINLVFGGNILRVSKEYLAVHSPVFNAMFYGNFAENKLEGIDMHDIVYEEFLDLLLLIFPGRPQISDSTVLRVLGLGDRFQMERVIYLAESHLLSTRKFTTVEKLRLADQYRLTLLMDTCFRSYVFASELATLQLTREFASFSSATKDVIIDRMKKLTKSRN